MHCPSEQSYRGYTHSHCQGQITSPYRVLEVTSTLNTSCLKHCWYEVHSTELQLITVPAVESKHYKDSTSEVKSTCGKEKDKANPSWIHLMKEQSTHCTQALSSLYEQKLKTGKFWSIPKLMPKKQHTVLRKTRLGWFQPFGDSITLSNHKMVTRLQIYNPPTSAYLNIPDLHLADWFYSHTYNSL